MFMTHVKQKELWKLLFDIFTFFSSTSTTLTLTRIMWLLKVNEVLWNSHQMKQQQKEPFWYEANVKENN